MGILGGKWSDEIFFWSGQCTLKMKSVIYIDKIQIVSASMFYQRIFSPRAYKFSLAKSTSFLNSTFCYIMFVTVASRNSFPRPSFECLAIISTRVNLFPARQLESTTSSNFLPTKKYIHGNFIIASLRRVRTLIISQQRQMTRNQNDCRKSSTD